MDRSYYRLETNQRLIEEAKNNPNRELAIVLGERLESADFDTSERLEEALERARDAERDANVLDDKLYELGVELHSLELMLSRRDERIAELEEQLKKGN